MQKSNWRKEIGILNEFVSGDNPAGGAGLIGLGANILKKVIQYSPRVQTAKKVFDVVKDVAPRIQKKLKPSQIKGRTNNPRGTVVSPPKTKPKNSCKTRKNKTSRSRHKTI